MIIKTNKEMIDEIISNVVGGKKKAHYLIYG
jgi:hypothetical protein